MSLHYLLDGYNVIYQMPSENRSSLEERRRELIRFVETRRPQGSLNNKVTVVFDGQPGVESPNEARFVAVTFSRHDTADDKIKRIVSEASNKKNIVVVTDDRAVQYAVRSLGAKVSDVRSFLSKGRGEPRKSTAGKKDGSAKFITKSDEYKITEELADIWIKKKKNK